MRKPVEAEIHAGPHRGERLPRLFRVVVGGVDDDVAHAKHDGPPLQFIEESQRRAGARL